MYPARVEEIYAHVKNIEKDKGARTTFFTGLGLLKTFRKWCVEKKYVAEDAEGFVFLDKYSDYASSIKIKDEYDEYVSERVKDITADLKSIF